VTIPVRAALSLVDPWVLVGPLVYRFVPLVGGTALLGVLVVGLARLARPSEAEGDRQAARFLFVALALALAHAAALVALLGHFAHVTAHYFAALAVGVALAAAVLVARRDWPATRLRAAAVGLVGLWLLLGAASSTRDLDGNLRLRRFELARWIDANLDPAARIGAWNAGELGYFSHRAVVNLDGLANDREYLAFLRSRRPVGEYLDRAGIAYLADYDAPDLSMPFRFTWDHAVLFRGAIPWSELRVVRADASAAPPLYLLERRRSPP
jgi:hypothetical protein